MDVVSEENRFTELFDRFEYLVGLSVYYASGTGWGSMGAFRRRYHDEALYEAIRGEQSGPHPMQVFRAELEAHGVDHPLLRSGFFGGSLERLLETQTDYVVQIRRVAKEDEFAIRGR